MSLDVMLKSAEPVRVATTCPHCGHTDGETEYEYYYDDNITHNLNKMAAAAGIYQHLWRPEELGITKASELIMPLRNGLLMLQHYPAQYKKYERENGWGVYSDLVEFVSRYLEACKLHPNAEIVISR